jgi:hypothetical protein
MRTLRILAFQSMILFAAAPGETFRFKRVVIRRSKKKLLLGYARLNTDARGWGWLILSANTPVFYRPVFGAFRLSEQTFFIEIREID